MKHLALTCLTPSRRVGQVHLAVLQLQHRGIQVCRVHTLQGLRVPQPKRLIKTHKGCLLKAHKDFSEDISFYLKTSLFDSFCLRLRMACFSEPQAPHGSLAHVEIHEGPLLVRDRLRTAGRSGPSVVIPNDLGAASKRLQRSSN